MSELKRPGQQEERLENKQLNYLREEALNFDYDGDEAVLARKDIDDEDQMNGDDENEDDGVMSPTQRDNDIAGTGANSNLFCYMCYESHDTPEDHLVAPCDCKGDTRYLHVQCLQKWYQSSLSGWRSLVIRTTGLTISSSENSLSYYSFATGSGAPACKICGKAYKTMLTNLDGVKTNIMEADHPGPYISLVVVTRHDTSPELFNTKFRLNFGPGAFLLCCNVEALQMTHFAFLQVIALGVMIMILSKKRYILLSCPLDDPPCVIWFLTIALCRQFMLKCTSKMVSTYLSSDK